MTERVPCERCQAKILPDTAERNEGLCVICSKPMRTESSVSRIKDSLFGVFWLCALPFYLIWRLALGLWRKFRFPFDHNELQRTARRVFIDRWKARLFVYGVEAGYATSDPRFLGFAQNEEYHQGKDVGGRLRRGEVSFQDIVSSSDYFGLIGKPVTRPHDGEQAVDLNT